MKLPHRFYRQLTALVGNSCVLTDELSLALYAYDCSVSRTRPDAVVLIENAAQIPSVLRLLTRYRVPFVVRAGATNHAGSCVALKGGVVLNLTALNQILEINPKQGYAIVEPGVLTGDLQQKLTSLGYFYAPDPASTRACTLGGNLAQNASGARCLKYGGTLDNVLAAHVVLPDGTPAILSREEAGADLVGLFAGSEGTLGVITQLKVKILPCPKHIQTFLVTFPSLQQCVETVTDLTSRGITPRCVEAMDKTTTRAVEDFSHAGYPTQAEALLILELDGTLTQIKKQTQQLFEVCQAHQAQTFVCAQDESARARLWQGRQSAYSAFSRLSPNVMVGDGTVARSQLPSTLAHVQDILRTSQLRSALLFHAGDGNFHPHILFDERNKLQTLHATRTMARVLKTCIDAQGTLSGEHGVGVEKRAVMAYQYETPTLQAMSKIKSALDPLHLANPLKILPYQFAQKARTAAPLPAQVEPLKQQLLSFQKNKQPFEIVGTNTRLKTKSKSVLSAAALNQIVEIDLSNYTATAQAGVKLAALSAALKKAGVYALLPNSKGTLGGLFCAGVQPAFYAQVLGIEALLKDGSYVRYGGKLMKNAAGYPLTRLFAGSQGQIGLVTQLTFKIFAAPQKAPRSRAFKKIVPGEVWSRLVQVFSEPAHD